MGKLKVSALLLGAALYMSLGSTTLLAGANCGKCATKSEKDCNEKCAKNCEKGIVCKDEKCNCKGKKAASTMKCGAGKCGSK